MWKKLSLVFFAILLVLTTVIFFGRGKLLAYTWCFWIFFLSPITAIIAFVVLLVILINWIQKRAVIQKVSFLVILWLASMPIAVLFGVSPIVYPDRVACEKGSTFEKPIENATYLGGREYKTHAYWPAERYAYDIVKEPYNTGSACLSDYGIYGQPVYSPVNGTIVAMNNSDPDIRPNSEQFTSQLGNYVVIKVEKTGTYVLMAHFMKDSIQVEESNFIRVGERIGKVGNSGTSSEPHLHIQHQKENPINMRFPILAQGLPMTFK